MRVHFVDGSEPRLACLKSMRYSSGPYDADLPGRGSRLAEAEATEKWATSPLSARFLGVAKDEAVHTMYLFTELCSRGSLCDYLVSLGRSSLGAHS